MAKTKVSQFDATASNNTDINSVNVAEGCPPSGINNAIREMASLLKKQEVGTDPMTSPDINGGTIDGATIGASSASTGAFTTISASGNVDFNGDIDVDGTTNLDVVDIDGAVDFASTTAHAGNATFADNAKAIFGSELEIYSDATHARIKENGSGQLKIQGNNMQLLTSDGTSTYLEGNASTGVTTLYHASNAPKLATASTGVNVTGGIGLGGTGTANILDDYEEGVFAPTIAGTGGGGYALNSDSDTLSYTKIGRQVTITGRLDVASTSSPVGDVKITGLPFVIGDLGDNAGDFSGLINFLDSSASTQTNIVTRAFDTQTLINLKQGSAVPAAGDSYYISFSYFTTA